MKRTRITKLDDVNRFSEECLVQLFNEGDHVDINGKRTVKHNIKYPLLLIKCDYHEQTKLLAFKEGVRFDNDFDMKIVLKNCDEPLYFTYTGKQDEYLKIVKIIEGIECQTNYVQSLEIQHEDFSSEYFLIED